MFSKTKFFSRAADVEMEIAMIKVLSWIAFALKNIWRETRGSMIGTLEMFCIFLDFMHI